MLTKIFIQQIERKFTKNNAPFSRVFDGRQWHSCFLDNHTILQEGQEALVEITKQGNYSNITRIESGPSVEGGVLSISPEKPISQLVQPAPLTQPIPPQPEVQQEIETTGGELLIEISNIINDITKNNVTLDENFLTNYELKLSALNVKLAQLYSVNYAELKNLEWSIKKRTKEIVSNLKTTMTIDQAKEEAERQLETDKVILITKRNKATSHDVIMSGVKNVLLALKDRIKFLRK